MNRATAEVLYECLHVLGAVAAALLVRYLLGVATPQQDMEALQRFGRNIASLVKLQDVFSGVNMERLTRLRDDIANGFYASDHIVVMPFIVIDGNEATHDETTDGSIPTNNHHDSGHHASVDSVHTNDTGHQPRETA